MTKSAKKFIIIHNLSSITRIMILTFFNIFLFKVIGLEDLMIYKIIYFSFSPFGFYLVYKFVNVKNFLALYRLSLFVYLVFFIFIICTAKSLPLYFPLFALLNACASSLLWSSYHYIIFELTKDTSTIKFMSITQTLAIIVEIITPLTLGILITKGSYDLVYLLLSVLTFCLLVASLSLKINLKPNKAFSLEKFFNIFTNNKIISSMYGMSAISGFTLKGALSETLMPILILMILGSEFSLGLSKSLFAVSAALVSFIFAKKIEEKHLVKANTITSLALVLTPAVFLITLNYYTVIVYFLFLEIFKNIDNTIKSYYLYSVLSFASVEKYKKEHIFIREIFLSCGRVLSYGAVVLLMVIFDKDIDVYRYLPFVLIAPELINIGLCRIIEKEKKI